MANHWLDRQYSAGAIPVNRDWWRACRRCVAGRRSGCRCWGAARFAFLRGARRARGTRYMPGRRWVRGTGGAGASVPVRGASSSVVTPSDGARGRSGSAGAEASVVGRHGGADVHGRGAGGAACVAGTPAACAPGAVPRAAGRSFGVASGGGVGRLRGDPLVAGHQDDADAVSIALPPNGQPGDAGALSTWPDSGGRLQ